MTLQIAGFLLPNAVSVTHTSSSQGEMAYVEYLKATALAPSFGNDYCLHGQFRGVHLVSQSVFVWTVFGQRRRGWQGGRQAGVVLRMLFNFLANLAFGIAPAVTPGAEVTNSCRRA